MAKLPTDITVTGTIEPYKDMFTDELINMLTYYIAFTRDIRIAYDGKWYRAVQIVNEAMAKDLKASPSFHVILDFALRQPIVAEYEPGQLNKE